MQKKRLEEAQLAFFRRVMGRQPDPSDAEPLTCAAAEKGLFDLAARLHQRFPPRDEEKAKPVPEVALVEAIVSMAEFGADEAFQGMRPRLRRAIRRRIATLLTVVVANEVKGNSAISFIPHGFPAEHVGMALLVTMGAAIPSDLRSKFE
ncbi:MAG: hypothetical protein ACK4JB_17330 [Reyranella sp.]